MFSDVLTLSCCRSRRNDQRSPGTFRIFKFKNYSRYLHTCC